MRGVLEMAKSRVFSGAEARLRSVLCAVYAVTSGEDDVIQRSVLIGHLCSSV